MPRFYQITLLQQSGGKEKKRECSEGKEEGDEENKMEIKPKDELSGSYDLTHKTPTSPQWDEVSNEKGVVQIIFHAASWWIASVSISCTITAYGDVKSPFKKREVQAETGCDLFVRSKRNLRNVSPSSPFSFFFKHCFFPSLFFFFF